MDEVQHFISPYQSRLRNHRPSLVDPQPVALRAAGVNFLCLEEPNADSCDPTRMRKPRGRHAKLTVETASPAVRSEAQRHRCGSCCRLQPEPCQETARELMNNPEEPPARSGVVHGCGVHRSRPVGTCRKLVPDAKGRSYVERFTHPGKTTIGRGSSTPNSFEIGLYRICLSFSCTRMLCVVVIGCRDESS